ncbi:MerR family transcriptional regulator [Altererythrobacter sp.]|jgi:DNA-binding transcriptional MerR regulator|uniref:MerR family transcriptional regulator n=1 Tax=Altererythrobacter sp. TaxID=1872480 RepID=UPI001B015419|nr:MerR family transcriptional regulator [Altererythrobacter sp.]MBO6944029.1 MerR family transcriptional regulator [Altererythrobacter sp.]
MSDFADGKDEGALRTIGEVSDALGIKQHVLRYWEQQFPMLKPLKRSGGRRYYRPADVELVETIDRLVNSEGYTLKGAKAAIRDGKRAVPQPSLAEKAGSQISVVATSAGSDVLPQLKAIRSRLAAALEA